jgi:hypothetical protein
VSTEIASKTGAFVADSVADALVGEGSLVGGKGVAVGETAVSVGEVGVVVAGDLQPTSRIATKIHAIVPIQFFNMKDFSSFQNDAIVSF